MELDKISKESSSILTSLFGEVFSEMGGIIADQQKIRRLKNQIKIFEKSNEILKTKNLKGLSVDLKLLAPLLNFTSLEENESIQNTWSELTVQIVTKSGSDAYYLKCINVLSALSVDDLVFMRKLLEVLKVEYLFYADKRNFIDNAPLLTLVSTSRLAGDRLMNLEIKDLVINSERLIRHFEYEQSKYNLIIENLFSVGLIHYAPFSFNNGVRFGVPGNEDISIDTIHNSLFSLTGFGQRFITEFDLSKY